MSLMGHERRFRAVRRVSAYPLTAAENQTVSNRSFGPTKGDIQRACYAASDRSVHGVRRALSVLTAC